MDNSKSEQKDESSDDITEDILQVEEDMPPNLDVKILESSNRLGLLGIWLLKKGFIEEAKNLARQAGLERD